MTDSPRRYSLSHPSVRKLLPPRSNGYAYTHSQLSGWVRRGLMDDSGTLVTLPAVKSGGQWAVTEVDMIEFLTRTGLVK